MPAKEGEDDQQLIKKKQIQTKPKQSPKHSQKLCHLPKLYEEGNANYLLYLKNINNVSWWETVNVKYILICGAEMSIVCL